MGCRFIALYRELAANESMSSVFMIVESYFGDSSHIIERLKDDGAKVGKSVKHGGKKHVTRQAANWLNEDLASTLGTGPAMNSNAERHRYPSALSHSTADRWCSRL
jgi:hypothetical protein